MRRAVFETERLILRPLRKIDYLTWYNANVHARPKQSPWDHGPRAAETCSIRRLKGLKIAIISLKLNRVEAAINIGNRKSIRLARMIGMRHECVRRRYWYENDQWTDNIIYVANPEDIGLKAQPPKVRK